MEGMETGRALPSSVEEDAQWEEWEAYLNTKEKEDLVQLILGRMSMDPSFCKYVCNNWGDSGKDAMGEWLISAFEQELLLELKDSMPDAAYIRSLCFRYYDAGEQITGKEAKKAYHRLLIDKIQNIDPFIFPADDREILEELEEDLLREMNGSV